MKTFIRSKILSLAAASALFSFVSSPSAYSAAGFSTSFEDYTAGSEVSGQNGWATNDPTGVNAGGSNIISNAFGDKEAALGGIYVDQAYYPGQGYVTLTHSSGLVNTTGGFQFDVDFSIANAATSTTPKDTFGFTFLIGNTEYATLLFTPQTQTAHTGANTDDVPNNKLNITVTYDGFTSAESVQAILYNNLIHLTVEVDLNDLFTATVGVFDVFGNGVDVDAANNKDPNALSDVGAVWDLFSPENNQAPDTPQTQAGNNAIYFDNVAVVPEPSTNALLIAAGIAGAVAYRRRRKAA